MRLERRVEAGQRLAHRDVGRLVHHDAERHQRRSRRAASRGTGAGRVARQRAAHVTELEHRDGRPEPVPADVIVVDRLRRQPSTSWWREVERQRVERVHGQVAEDDRWDHRERVAAPGRDRAAARSRSRPSASVPRWRAITIANERPRANAARPGSAGSGSTDAHDMSSSGSDGSSSLHVRSTSAERSKGKNIAPA